MTEIKKVKFTISGDKPLEISEDVDGNALELDASQQKVVHQLGKTIRSYIESIKELLSGRYAHLKEWAPVYLSDPGNILVAVCLNGIVLRFERKNDTQKVMASWFQDELSVVASLLSQKLINFYPDKNYTSTVPTNGIELQLIKGNLSTKEEENIATVKIGFDVVIEQPKHLPKVPHKPYCLLSIHNSVEIHIEGILGGNDSSFDNGQRFLTRSPVRLPVGWECIEIYPFFDLEQWNPEYASVWAENDLLAAVAASQFREIQFHSLDPKAGAREQYAKLLKEYKNLLDSNPDREETLQIFLNDHPELLSPTKTKMWSKLALGNRKTDFVFQEAADGYLLVELERSTYQLFNKDGHPSQDLNHARGQIIDWKRYLEDNLSTVQRELGLPDISVNPRSLIVIGRSSGLSPESRRKLTVMENESPKLKIMTYDDVYENAKSVVENLLGPIWEVAGNTRVYYLPS